MYLKNTENKVRNLVREMLHKVREITLLDDSKVTYGSEAHVEYLEDMLRRLNHERNKYRRGSSTRSDYSAACRRTRARLIRAKRYAEKNGVK